MLLQRLREVQVLGCNKGLTSGDLPSSIPKLKLVELLWILFFNVCYSVQVPSIVFLSFRGTSIANKLDTRIRH